jgi:hypothetical protein
MHDWLTDIGQQGYELSPEKQDENQRPFFDARDLDDEPVFEVEDEYENDGVAV